MIMEHIQNDEKRFSQIEGDIKIIKYIAFFVAGTSLPESFEYLQRFLLFLGGVV